MLRWNKPVYWCIEQGAQDTFAAHGDLLLQHFDALEQEAEEKGGVQQLLAEHFAKVFKINLPVAA